MALDLITKHDFSQLQDQSGTFEIPDELPFVDRENECAEMAYVICYNARRLQLLIQNGRDDCRTYQVLAAIQMFGSGKTTIAKEFLKQLSISKVQELFDSILNRKHPDDKVFRDFMCEAYCKLRDHTHLIFQESPHGLNLTEFILSIRISSREKAETALETLTAYLNQPQWSSKNIFFVLDEMGGWATAEVHGLLTVFKTYLTSQVQAKSERIVAFMLMGKGLSLQALGRGSPTSPLTYAWVKLHMLQPADIKEVISKLQSKNQACLANVTANNMDSVAQALHRWTAGAPRLLKYCLRMLQLLSPLGEAALTPVLSSDSLDGRGFEKELANKIFEIPTMSSELSPGNGDKFNADQCLTLYLLAKYRRVVSEETYIVFPRVKVPLTDLLRYLPVFISRVQDPASSNFLLVFPSLVVHRLVEWSGTKSALVVPSLSNPGVQHWALFEHLVRMRFISEGMLKSSPICKVSDVLGITGSGSMMDDLDLVVKSSEAFTTPKVERSASELEADGVSSSKRAKADKSGDGKGKRDSKAKFAASGAACAFDGDDDEGDDQDHAKVINRKQYNSFFETASPHAWYHSASEKSRESDGKYVGVRKDGVRHIVETQQKFRSPDNPFLLSSLQDEVDKCLSASEKRLISFVLMTTLLNKDIHNLMGDMPCLLLPSGTYYRSTTGNHLIHCQTGSVIISRLITKGQTLNVYSKQMPNTRPVSINDVQYFVEALAGVVSDKITFRKKSVLVVPAFTEVVVLSHLALRRFLGEQDYHVLLSPESLDKGNEILANLAEYEQRLNPTGASGKQGGSDSAAVASAPPVTLEQLLASGKLTQEQYIVAAERQAKEAEAERRAKEAEAERRAKEAQIAYLQERLGRSDLTDEERTKFERQLDKAMGLE